MYVETILDLSEIKTKLKELENFCRSNPVYRREHKKEIIRYLVEPLGIYLKKHIKILDKIHETNNIKTNDIVGYFHRDPSKEYSYKKRLKNVNTIDYILPHLRPHPSSVRDLNMVLTSIPSNWTLKITVVDNGLTVPNANTINTKKLLVSYYNYYKDMVNFILHNKPYELMILL